MRVLDIIEFNLISNVAVQMYKIAGDTNLIYSLILEVRIITKF